MGNPFSDFWRELYRSDVKKLARWLKPHRFALAVICLLVSVFLWWWHNPFSGGSKMIEPQQSSPNETNQPSSIQRGQDALEVDLRIQIVSRACVRSPGPQLVRVMSVADIWPEWAESETHPV